MENQPSRNGVHEGESVYAWIDLLRESANGRPTAMPKSDPSRHIDDCAYGLSGDRPPELSGLCGDVA